MGKFDLEEKMLKDHEEGKINIGKEPSDKDTDNEKQSPSSQAEKILQLVSGLELFHDEHDTPYTFIDGNVVNLESKKFTNWLSYQYQKSEKRAPSRESLKQAISSMTGKAIFEGEKIKLHVRVAEKEGAFYYDLGNGKAIMTTTESWSIVDAPILFKRYSHQQEQVVPVRGGNPWELFDYINVSKKNGHNILVMVLLISYFIPDFPHPILCIHGAQGAGKTSCSKCIKKLCDPSSAEVLITPKNRSDLIQTISHNSVCLFDNISSISNDVSDILCSASTGAGFPKRKLYTDDEDIIISVKKCIGINGINQLIVKPDLMERTVLLELERIDRKNRKTEKALWKSFNQRLPHILGGIFDVLVKAMAIYPTVKLKEQPRMADFCKWGYAIAEALGVGGDKFLKAYYSNIERLNEEVIQGNTLLQAMILFMNDRESWVGTVGEAYKKLKELAEAASPLRDDYTFPKHSNYLGRSLAKIKANLQDLGVSYSIGTHKFNGTPINFEKNTQASSASSIPNNIDELYPDDDMRIPGDSFELNEDTMSMAEDINEESSVKKTNNNDDYDYPEDAEDRNKFPSKETEVYQVEDDDEILHEVGTED